MGIHPAPNYADIFMARKVDKNIWKIIELMKKIENGFVAANLLLLKRFLDDLFQIFRGTTKQIHKLHEEINKIHPAIQFTMEHTDNTAEKNEDKCDFIPKSEISFLDTLCKISEGKIEMDLCRKDSDRNQYLLPSSIHPKTVAKIYHSHWL